MNPVTLARELLGSTVPWAGLREELARGEGPPVVLEGLRGSLRGLALAALQAEIDRPLLAIVPDGRTARNLLQDFRASSPGLPAEGADLFPALEGDPYGGVASHPDTLRSRVRVLSAADRLRFVALPARALAIPVPAPGDFAGKAILLRRDAELPPEALRLRLTELGYHREDAVGSRGDFSHRGYILDLFAPDASAPHRIEFFGDSIASIRTFDTATQRSTGELREIRVPPMREWVATEEDLADRWVAAVSPEGNPRDPALATWKEALRREGTFPGFEFFHWALPLPRATLLDHFPRALVVVASPETSWAALEEAATRLRGEHADSSPTPLPPPDRFLLPPEVVRVRTERTARILTDLMEEPPPGARRIAFTARRTERYQGKMPRFLEEVRERTGAGEAIGAVFTTHGRLGRTIDLLAGLALGERIGWRDGQPAIAPEAARGKILLGIAGLLEGFVLAGPFAGSAIPALHLYTEPDLFAGEMAAEEPGRRRVATAAFASDLRDLKAGDCIVHVDHGIGRYRGVQTMGVGADAREFLILEYQDGGLLYQPVDRLDLVQKYSGVEGMRPRLDRLGGVSWRKVKSRIKASMQDMAKELLNLYAARLAVPGHAFPADTPWQREFEESFPWEETPDQARSIEEVKRDMESEKPMDRLVVGDVGFGKTEVAMRAAFKAVQDGRQVALLAPTTVLAFQHFRTFSARFEAFPARIELLSRFRSPAEIKASLARLASGGSDIAIGTHRLLSKDVHFKRLGLLVVDEEQRFGVRHKERIKSLRRQVDVLTLSATPIPRTLQMSLAGIRDMSVIQTAPRNRYAIQTQVLPFRRESVQAALRQELERGGQVYFVHNRVESIYAMAAFVRELAPGARILVGHGQMPEDELERTIVDFIEGKADILVTTTIIENGVDIPRVNTIVVNRSDLFGLSQLYQLRGRVGRSDQQAFAYLFVPSVRDLLPVQRRRLEALLEFSELGSGFRIAALDLEIRGAGNMLGSEQHGHIAAVGFELYCQLLERTVQELKGGPVRPEVSAAVSLPGELHLPETYIPDSNQRLSVYKRISSAQSPEEVDEIVGQVADQFGHPPESLDRLAAVARLRIRADRMGISAIESRGKRIAIRFREDADIDLDALMEMLQADPRFSFRPEGLLDVRLLDGEDPAAVAGEILDALE